MDKESVIVEVNLTTGEHRRPFVGIPEGRPFVEDQLELGHVRTQLRQEPLVVPAAQCVAPEECAVQRVQVCDVPGMGGFDIEPVVPSKDLRRWTLSRDRDMPAIRRLRRTGRRAPQP